MSDIRIPGFAVPRYSERVEKAEAMPLKTQADDAVGGGTGGGSGEEVLR